MAAWMIVIGILLIINLIRIGVWCEYSDSGFALALKVSCFNIKFLPAKPKTPEEIEASKLKKAQRAEKARLKKEKKKAKEEEKKLKRAEKIANGEILTEEAQKKGGALDIVLSAISPGFDAVGTFFRHLKIKRLRVYYTSAGDDPFDAIMTYGGISAGVSVLNAYFYSLNVKERDFRSYIDLTADKPRVYIEAQLGMHLWEYIYIVLRLVVKFLVRYIKRTVHSRRQAAERV